MQLDTKTIKLIQNQLRQASIIWHVRSEVLKSAKTRSHIGKYKNGKDKYKVKYKCAHCERPYNIEQVEVDHIVEVANDTLPPSKMDEKNLFKWISQLFCDIDNLQVLCIGCHQAKTNNFNKGKFRGKRISLI